MLKRLVWLLLSLVGLYALTGFIAVPYVVKTQAAGWVREHTQGSLSIEAVRFNPFTFRMEAESIRLSGPHGMVLLKIGSVEADADLYDLYEQKILLPYLTLHGIRVNVAHFNTYGWSYEWLTAPVAAEMEPEASYFYQLGIDAFALKTGSADLKTHEIAVTSVTITRPAFSITRYRPFEGAAPQKTETPEEAAAGAGWRIRLAALELDDGRLAFEDFSIPGAAYVVNDRLHVNVSGIDSREDAQMAYDLQTRINETGSIAIRGTFRQEPLAVSARVDIDALPLKQGDAYLKRYTHASLEQGALSMHHTVRYAPSESGPDLTVDGNTSLQQLRINDTRDGTLLTSLERLEHRDMHLELFPGSLSVAEIVVSDPYAHVVFEADKTLNLATLLKQQPGAPEQKTAPAAKTVQQPEAFTFNVAKVSVSGASADFADREVPAGFTSRIAKFGGTVTDISSDTDAVSTIAAEGTIDGSGTLSVKGNLMPSDPKRLTELKLALRNLSMERFTPYSGRYIGRKIDGGDLYVDLGYKVAASKIKGDNGVILRQISFGDAVESKEAVSLPLDLAVALLKDGEGVIDVDLPVEGDLDNPEFKYGAAVWKAVVNLLSNVATAPFKFLGSLLGIEGDTLKFVEFEPGRAVVMPSEEEKLALLAKALSERPGLNLRMESVYDRAQDGQALREAKADTLIGERKLNDANRSSGGAPESAMLESLVAPTMKPEALTALRAELAKQYADDKTVFERMYNQALKTRLVEAQTVSDAELAGLALERSGAVAAYLMERHGFEAGRIVRSEASASQTGAQRWVRMAFTIEAGKN